MAPLGVVSDLIRTNDGSYMAVGVVGWNGAVWRSADGTNWTEVADVPAIGPEEAKALGHVIQTANGFLAWGGQGPRYSEPYLSVIWTSVDGSHWQETSVLNGFLLDVIAGGPGFIGVGSQAGLDNLNGAVAWWSPDAVTWTESAIDPPQGGMLDVEPFRGAYLAVGATRGEGGWLAGEVWTSQDGKTWSQTAQGTDLPAALSKMVISGGQIVAAGSISVDPAGGDLQRPAIEISVDGSTWTQPFSHDCCAYMNDLVAAGDQLFGTYRWYAPAEGLTGTALVRSEDGVHWTDSGTIPLDAGVSWQHLRFVGGDLGLIGLGLRDIPGDEYQPVLLLSPANLTP